HAQEGTDVEKLMSAVRFHAGFALENRTYLRVYFSEARQLDEPYASAHVRHRNRHRDLWLDLLLAADAASSVIEAKRLYGYMITMINLGSPPDMTQSDLDW